MDESSQTRTGEGPNQASHTPIADSLEGAVQLIRNHLETLQKRTRRIVWLDTLAALVSALILLFFLAAALDWWLRPSSLLGRFSFFTGILLVAGGIIGWFIWKRLRHPISKSAIARRLEAVFPNLGDRLSSTASLLEKNSEPNELPNELTATAIQQTARELERCEPQKRITWSSAAQSLLMASVMVALVLLFFFWRPAGASLVTQRLFSPISQAQWPQRNQLVLENVPEKAHRGTDLEIFVRDAMGNLPQDVQLLVRSTSNSKTISLPLKLTGEAAVGNLTVGDEDIEVRATGGDDVSMPWRRIEVLDAPTIQEFRITLSPPDYLAQAPFEIAETEFKVLAGTTMQFEAVLSLPVQSASLVLKTLGNQPQSLPLITSPDSTTISSSEVRLDASTDFHVAWVDMNGLTAESRRRWRASVDEDTVPRVVLKQPESDQEVTPAANLSALATAEDNLGITTGWIEVQHLQAGLQGQLGLQTNELPTSSQNIQWNGNIRELIDTLLPTENEDPSKPNPPSAVNALQEGSTLELTAVAIDTAGQRGQSTTRRLRIVSPQSMQQAIARQQSEALNELQDARTQQEIALEQTQAARARLGNTDAQRQAAADRIQAASAAQQTAARAISDSTDSAQKQLSDALRKAIDNQLDNQQLQALRDAVQQLAENDVPRAQTALQQAAEQLIQNNEAQTEQQLENAEQAQQAALQQLDKLVQSMRRDDTKRQANDQLAELAASQARLAQQSRDASQAINPQAERDRLAQRQRELARTTEQLTQQLQTLAESLETQNEQDNPANTNASLQELENIRDALEILEKGLQEESQISPGSTASTMRQAASELQRGRAGQTETLQQEIQQQLDQARRRLSGNPSTAKQTAQDQNEQTQQTFATEVQQALSRQDLIVDQLQNEPTLTLKSLAGDQQSVAELTTKAAKNPQAPPGFDSALQDAATDMQTSAALMQRETERETAIESATSALRRLRFIADSLLSQSPTAENNQDQNAQPREGEGENQDQPSSVPAETIRLLRATQDFLRTRTEEIVSQQASSDAPSFDPVRAARIEAQKRQLADEQTRLVQKIEQFVKQLEQDDAP